MIKILFAINKFAVGGAERLVVDQINRLDKNIFFVSALTLFFEGEHGIREELLIPKERQTLIFFRSFFDARAYCRLIMFLRKERFDIIVSNLFFTNTVVRVAALAAFLFDAKKPVVVAYEHNIYRYKKRRHFFVDWALSFATVKIVAVSEAVSRFLVGSGHISAEKIAVLHNGVAIPSQCALARKEARKKYRIPENAFLILSVGRVTEQKGYPYLIDAAATLIKHGMKDSLFLIIGAEEQKFSTELRQVIQEKKMSKTVRLLGSMKHCDVMGYLSAADVFCMPSLWEGFGIAAVEAMMLGKPVVASNIDGLCEIVRDGKDGFLVPPRDAGAIAGAIRHLADEPALLEQCGRSAKEHALLFSFGEHMLRLKELLVSLQSR